MIHNLCPATVFHVRNLPKKNLFSYQVFYLLLDLDQLGSKFKFLSFEKFNLFSFYNKDHSYQINKGSDANLKSWIKNILAAESIEADKVMLLCHPRVLGYVFNPVSFWFCLNQKEQLIAVLAEVHNTFGEQHSYLIYNVDKTPIDGSNEHFAKKEFHVSPFFKRQGHYRFKFDYGQKKITAFIDYFDQEQLVLQTSLVCKRRALSDGNLIKTFFVIPFVTFKVIFLIHYQALKIIFKGIKYIAKPAQFLHKITKTFK